MKLPEITKLLEHFESESRQSWVDRVEKSLSPEQMILDQELNVSILQGRLEDSIFAKFNRTFKIGQAFHYDGHEKHLNKHIRDALLNGLEHLIIVINKDLTESHATELLEGIIPSYILTTFLLSNTSVSLSLNAEWQANSSIVYLNDHNGNWLTVQSEMSVSDSITNAFSQCISRFDQYETFFLNVSISDNYLSEIAKLRAIHHIFNQLNEAHNWKYRFHIIATYGDPHHQDSDYQKISNTARATAAILGGATTILPYSLTIVDLEEHRLASNQLHLLRLESYLDKVPDPLCGSHLIESLTDALARKVWDKLNEIL